MVPTKISQQREAKAASLSVSHSANSQARVRRDEDDDDDDKEPSAPPPCQTNSSLSLTRSEGRVPISRASTIQYEDNDDNYDEPSASHAPRQSSHKRLNHEGRKRARSESVESFRESKVTKIVTGQRPKASDFEDKESILVAITIYRCMVSTSNPFPDHPTEVKLAQEAWEAACQDLDTYPTLTPKMCKLVNPFFTNCLHIDSMYRSPTALLTSVGS